MTSRRPPPLQSFRSSPSPLGCEPEPSLGADFCPDGANGSGKTTLINIMSGFLSPDGGDVHLDSRPIKAASPHEVARRGISRTFQDMRLISKLSVRENVLLAFSQQRGEAWWRVFFSNREEENKLMQKANEILKTCFIEYVSDSLLGKSPTGNRSSSI